MTKAKETVLGDRERILSTVVRGLLSTQIFHRGDGYHSATYTGSTGMTDVHFALDQTPVKGDLVIANSTIWPNPWSIGWFESKDENGNYVIREIGTGMLCNYSNETFVPIRGLSNIDLLEGEQYRFYQKVLKVFSTAYEYNYRFGGIKFTDDEVAVTIRAAWGEGVPFDIVMPFKKMGVATILKLMRKDGYGSRPYQKLDH